MDSEKGGVHIIKYTEYVLVAMLYICIFCAYADMWHSYCVHSNFVVVLYSEMVKFCKQVVLHSLTPQTLHPNTVERGGFLLVI